MDKIPEEKPTLNDRVVNALDYLIARLPCQTEHQWTSTTPDDPIQWCSQCGMFKTREEQTNTRK